MQTAILGGRLQTKSPTERKEERFLDWSEARAMNLELCTLAGLLTVPMSVFPPDAMALR
jgi:hypothetical protein